MGLNKDYFRHSARITKTKRWKRLRFEALRRDNFQCVQCGARGRLEVDHIEPVRTRPDLAWDLNNLQTLCKADHTRKTRAEIDLPQLSPQRQKWRDFLDNEVIPDVAIS